MAYPKDATTVVATSVWLTARKFLRFYFGSIEFDYDRLTAYERTLCSRSEFEALLQALKLRRPSDDVGDC